MKTNQQTKKDTEKLRRKSSERRSQKRPPEWTEECSFSIALDQSSKCPQEWTKERAFPIALDKKSLNGNNLTRKQTKTMKIVKTNQQIRGDMENFRRKSSETRVSKFPPEWSKECTSPIALDQKSLNENVSTKINTKTRIITKKDQQKRSETFRKKSTETKSPKQRQEQEANKFKTIKEVQ